MRTSAKEEKISCLLDLFFLAFTSIDVIRIVYKFNCER